jgi:hypothetical protein
MGIDRRLEHTNRKISAGDTRISLSAGWTAAVPDAIAATGSFVAAELSDGPRMEKDCEFVQTDGKRKGNKES